MQTGNETITQYSIDGKLYDVVGCWDSETPEGEYDFYDLYDSEGHCLNEGEPFYCKPTIEEVTEYLDTWWKE